MPETRELVINTGPLIALVAATGDLSVLRLYERVLVPFEVVAEMRAGGSRNFALDALGRAQHLHLWPTPTPVPAFLANSLDGGEAAVIQLALDEKVATVCIDEVAGRRYARLSGLQLTGSLGILLRAKREGLEVSLRTAVSRMKRHGIHLGAALAERVLKEAGEE